MSLLDSQSTDFVITWEGNNLPLKISAKIENGKKEKLGSIISKELMTRQTDLFDAEDHLVLTAFKSRRVWKDTYEIKDSMEKFLGSAKVKGVFRTKMIIENSEKNEILNVRGSSNVVGVHEMKSPNDNTVAKFEITMEEVKKNWAQSDYYNTCNLHIGDIDFDKKILWGSFISYLSHFYDVSPSGG